jgi:uncharacterized protein DUF6178
MAKSVHRTGRRRATALPAPIAHADPRRLLDRILDTPQLAAVVPRLPPEVLQRMVRHCGLEDCGELVALTTPDQFARVLDLDLWRAEPGRDEQFDAARFGVWLEVLMECGATIAARKMTEIDADLMIAALSQHALVFDAAAVSRLASDDEDNVAGRSLRDGLGCEVGGYLVLARGTDSWDAIAAALVLLEHEHPTYFHRVMRGCRGLSHSAPEIDGLDNLASPREQAACDLAVARDRRRERQGFVTPADARAFLQLSRQLPLGGDAAPTGDPVAAGYFRSMEWTAPADTAPDSDATAASATVVDALLDAGVLVQPVRALLDDPRGDAPRLARIQAHMQTARESGAEAYIARTQELAYLSNALAAGCAIQARPFTPQESTDAAVAICNLGLENWPRRWPSADSLVTVFQVGWTVLHADVTMYAATQLISVLTHLHCDDRETRLELGKLRRELRTQCRTETPWRAREAMEVLSTVDMPAWATLLGLIDECPVIHGAMAASRSGTHAVSASAFEFISENAQIAAVRDFMRALPELLRA